MTCPGMCLIKDGSFYWMPCPGMCLGLHFRLRVSGSVSGSVSGALRVSESSRTRGLLSPSHLACFRVSRPIFGSLSLPTAGYVSEIFFGLESLYPRLSLLNFSNHLSLILFLQFYVMMVLIITTRILIIIIIIIIQY